MTLLVFTLDLPRGVADLGDALRDLWPNFISLAISFVVIAAYWMVHHRLFALVRRCDAVLLWLNLALLFCIVVLPFPTSLLGEYGDEPLAVAIYAVWVALTGIASTLLARHAMRGGRLMNRALDPFVVKARLWHGAIAPIVFVGSLPLLLIGASAAKYAWLAIIPAGAIVRRLFRNADGDDMTTIADG